MLRLVLCLPFFVRLPVGFALARPGLAFFIGILFFFRTFFATVLALRTVTFLWFFAAVRTVGGRSAFVDDVLAVEVVVVTWLNCCVVLEAGCTGKLLVGLRGAGK